MSRKVSHRISASLVCAASIVLASTALAGEVTGTGKSLKNPDGTLNGKSACAFSGLEDHPIDPGTTQSWGQIPRAVRVFLVSIGVYPGVACNPTKAGGEPG